MDTITLGDLDVSRFILGGNPFSGFSHLTRQTDDEQRHWYTCERIKATYREAERLGITAHVGRADHHIARVLMEHWDEGGRIQWIAQTCPEIGTARRGALSGIRFGAKAVFIQGGQMDHYRAHGRLDEVPPIINMIHDAGLPAGVAGHTPEVFAWAEDHLDCDFYMCSYYNPIPRDDSPENLGPQSERYDEADRESMTAAIQHLSKPVIHYKILAAGRHDPAAAFRYAATRMRPTDAVCVGIYTKHRPNELEHDTGLLEKCLSDVADGRRSDSPN
ncbi:MAG TPA: hypothetical protein VMY87_01365 [Armatimonadota bacterium]|nr:hypothetical protein [Armatimonadota bacterium]